ncbi:uncharacterized protein TRUGW13939_07806 [Talaromyces rugulosus]|uniref:Extracellular mutant protein 11 C-terminal domain-containing protein n=1 Tax=Talaromyces rugulosus TaxID=121627 RepID=A0A7H8R2P9_TALRU|nr:uncharacterized protein TRUGW13939_07806 [Talaromyces rugulosus]QKX60660.1 hypothetical protein TRUGW13939_07806 [Talaromyces rugulosus]
MGVGEYIHAREGDHHQPFQRSNTEQLFKLQQQQQQQQQQDRQAKERSGSGIQYSRFTRPFSWQHETYTQQLQQQQQQEEEEEAANYKSVFDTDVEGVDDSTITVTSVAAGNDHGFEIFGNRHVNSINWNDSVPSESDQPVEDQVEIDEEFGKHSPVSLIGGDEANAKKKVTDTLDWVQYQVSQQSTTGNDTPASKRKSLIGQRTDQSRIPMASSRMALNRSDSDPVPRFSSATDEETKMAQMAATHRRNNLSRSLATTPNNRFNFKTERPYERLIQQTQQEQEQSPTRRASGPRPQPPERQSSSKPTGLFKRDQAKNRERGESSFNYYDSFLDNNRIRSTLDATDDEGFEDDTLSSINIPSPPPIKKTHQKLPATTTPAVALSLSDFDHDHDHDQKFESDYPDEILQQMQYSQLEKESFDHTPTPPAITTPKEPTTSQKTPSDDAKTASEKLSFVLNSLPIEEDRHRYLSSMTLPEWEEFGDELIGRLGDMMSKIKDARHARRKTTAVFEAEIKRRHEDVQKRDRELDRKLGDMKQGGMGVLKGLKPK